MDVLSPDDPVRIGPYRLLRRLGQGGMGRVYLARSQGGRTVAVKLVHREYAAQAEFRRRFAREVAAARRVGGTWTAPVLDADTEAEVPWVATGYIPGPSLDTVIDEHGPLPETSLRVLAHRLALALDAIHGTGLVHRDLKPSNILITVDGPLVIDFGIARALDTVAGAGLTRTGAIVGSPGFMSPEQVRGRPITPASDMFCLGSVLAFAALGRPPFGSAEAGIPALLLRVAEDEPDLTGLPPAVDTLVRDCLRKDPAERPTPRQIAERTAPAAGSDAAAWLPGALLAQLGRHAAELLNTDGTDTAPDAAAAGPPASAEPPTASAVRPVPSPPPEPPDNRQRILRARLLTAGALVITAVAVLVIILLNNTAGSGHGDGAGAQGDQKAPTGATHSSSPPAEFHGAWEGTVSDGPEGLRYLRLYVPANASPGTKQPPAQILLAGVEVLCKANAAQRSRTATRLVLDPLSIADTDPNDGPDSACALPGQQVVTATADGLHWTSGGASADLTPTKGGSKAVPTSHIGTWDFTASDGTDPATVPTHGKVTISQGNVGGWVARSTGTVGTKHCEWAETLFETHDNVMTMGPYELDPDASDKGCRGGGTTHVYIADDDGTLTLGDAADPPKVLGHLTPVQ